ncbi:hypothetical protein PQR75_41995 [Paraburkholderia fungorum]|uniref:hypothetical protein n=1 Tax=Paraburkholderia fungorum TaxID=134537 RepID=UPI0038B92108
MPIAPYCDKTVVSGSSELDTRGIEDIIYVPIECDLNTLQFDAGLETLCEVVTKAHVGVRARINEDWEIFPEILDIASKDVCEALETALFAEVGKWFRMGSLPRVKVAMAMYERWNHSDFQLSYPHGFDGLPDVGYDELRSPWESNVHTVSRVLTSSQWTSACWRAVVPVSRRVEQDKVPIVDGHPERPLLFVIEFDATCMTTDPVILLGFEKGITDILQDVLVYGTGSGLYRAVQRTTSSPWH